MSNSSESLGSKRERINSTTELVTPVEGQAFTVHHVRSRLGFLASVSGRVMHPVEKQDNPVKVLNHNGFLATSSIYDGVAEHMASLGATTAVFDTWHPLTPKDFEDPLVVSSMGGHRMIDIMEEISGEETDVVAVGHSMGGLSAARLAAHDQRVNYWIGDASAGIEAEHMLDVHIQNMPEILKKEAIPLGKHVVKKVGAMNLVKDYAKKFGLNPTQVVRQAILLCKNPDITPFLMSAREGDRVMTAAMLHEFDEFFHQQKQLDAINEHPGLYDHVEKVAGTKHIHANMYPVENGIIRMDVVRHLQSRKLAAKATSLTVAN